MSLIAADIGSAGDIFNAGSASPASISTRVDAHPDSDDRSEEIMNRF
jgi:hypothetical protein